MYDGLLGRQRDLEADLHQPADAFPGVAPRPVAPNLTLRTFDVPDTTASAVRLVALENQCTGRAGVRR